LIGIIVDIERSDLIEIFI